MFRKSVVLACAAGLLIFCGWVGIAGAADAPSAPAPTVSNTAKSCTLTNMKFAEFLAQKYGINLGEAEKTMTPDEKYKALANALSEKGIKYFSTAKPGDMPQCSDSAGVLYAVAGGPDAAATSDAKIGYLVKNGFLKLPAPNSDPCDTLCNIEEAFGAAVAEKFSPPPVTPPPTNPPGETPERPSSRIE